MEWPPELDAVIAAPRHHTLLFENERVRILDTRIPPGETTAVHTHRWPSAAYVIAWDHHVRRDASGVVEVDSRAGGPLPACPFARWLPPLPPHALENVGTNEIHVISVELKDE